MDEFGVLVESIGFKAHGKSAPMTKSIPKPKSRLVANTAPMNDSSSLPIDELDVIFRSNLNIEKNSLSQNFLGDDDIFGGHVSNSNHHGDIDLESVLNSSSNRAINNNLDSSHSICVNSFDDLLGSRSGQSDSVNDLLGSQFLQSDSVDDLMGFFGGNSTGKQEIKGSEFDDLIPGFGGASPTNKGVKPKIVISPESTGLSSNLSSTIGDDPFLVFESYVAQSDAFADPSEQDIREDPIQSALEELDDFAIGTTTSGFENIDELDTFFGGGVQQKHAVPISTSQDSQFDIFGEGNRPESKQTSSRSSSSKTTTSATNLEDNFTALFGDIATSSGEFQEVEGEPEERRRARLNRHIRMNARMADALAEKNQRDLQSQHDQEEKRRLAETLDNDLRLWAAGKEGNLRALLSSLQLVLWPECGWAPVSLTDLITSDSVKKVYKKATLYVHPDKVQQKGATLRQKYIAEKVFDLLKESWNKFSAEELG